VTDPQNPTKLRFCHNPIFRLFRVQVLHPTTRRKTWQIWKFCEPHFQEFIATEGKGWGRRYPKDPILHPVINTDFTFF
jgi:hypothetical protein